MDFLKSSSSGKPKLETLHSPNKRNSKVIKSYEDSDNSKSTSSSKVSFWGSPDLSAGIEDLLTAMVLSDNSKSFIISISLRNMEEHDSTIQS